MSDNNNKKLILSVRDLKISFKTDEGLVHAVRGVSFDLFKGETLCIVGESGSGKSVTSKTIMGILPASAVIEEGEIIYQGEDLTKIDETEFHRIRGHKIGMIFQDPLSSLNPIMKVGKQITEAMLVNKNRLARMKDQIISQEEANYKNNKVRRDSKIEQAFGKVQESDGEFDSKISMLDRNLKDISFKMSTCAKGSKEYDELALEYKNMSASNKKTKVQLIAEKKQEHKKLLVLAKGIKKEAERDYKKEQPLLKAALKKKEKEAVVEIKAYQEEKEKEYKNNILLVDKEIADIKNNYEKTISQMKNGLSSAASRLLAKQELEKKVQEYEDKLKAAEEKKIGIADAYRQCFKITKKEAREEALKVMAEVGIPQPEIRFNQYPFEFSGGMRQRIVIAIALTANPEVLICDEPTTALDVTIQAQILELINKLKRERNMSIIFITHDLGVVANMADRVAVMYAGKIVEVGTANEIFYDPRHPYTWALLSSIPDIDSHEKLEAIPGTPPYLLYPPKGDAFAARNKYALAVDFKEDPPFFKITDTHYAATWLLDKRAPKTEKPKIVSQRIKASLERAGVKNESEL